MNKPEPCFAFRGELVWGLAICAVLGITGCSSDSTQPDGAAGASPSAGAGGLAGAAGAATGFSGSPVTAGSGGAVAGSPTSGGSGGDTTSAGAGGTLADGGSAGSTGGAAGSAFAGAAGAAGSSGGGNCNGAALCDSFERTTLGPDWTVDNDTPANTIELVTDKSHSGTTSVHMKFGATKNATFIDESKGFPPLNDAYWGRVWLFMMTGLEGGHHVYVEGSTGADPSNTGIRALNTQNAGFLATNDAPPDKGGTSTTTKMPQGMWTCFEWHVAATGSSETVNLYMNGSEVPGTAASTTPTVKNLIKERIGYERYANGATGELWIDDYAIGSARLTCN